MTNKYKNDFLAAVDELQRLETTYSDLGTQIARQKKKVAALHELADLDDEGIAAIGLVDGITDAVRTVFRSAEKPLNPAEVRTRVEALGLPPQKNILASVHTVIRRLQESGEIAPVGDVSFGGGYRWMGRLHERVVRKTLLERMGEVRDVARNPAGRK